jgi:hypothetical protein
MRIDLSDLDRLTGIAEALGRLFWCLMVLAFFTSILGSHGTGLLVLVLGAASFVVRAGLEDFVRAHRDPADASEPAAEAEAPARTAPEPPAPADPEFTVYRASRRPRRPRRTKSAV